MNERCREMRERLSAYLDHELPPDEARRVEEHLAGCADCARALEVYATHGASLASVPVKRTDAEWDALAEAVDAAVAADSAAASPKGRRAAPRWFGLPRPVLLGSAATVAVALLIAVLQPQFREPRPAPAPQAERSPAFRGGRVDDTLTAEETAPSTSAGEAERASPAPAAGAPSPVPIAPHDRTGGRHGLQSLGEAARRVPLSVDADRGISPGQRVSPPRIEKRAVPSADPTQARELARSFDTFRATHPARDDILEPRARAWVRAARLDTTGVCGEARKRVEEWLARATGNALEEARALADSLSAICPE